jgi:hypothetical protein
VWAVWQGKCVHGGGGGVKCSTNDSTRNATDRAGKIVHSGYLHAVCLEHTACGGRCDGVSELSSALCDACQSTLGSLKATVDDFQV